MLRKLFRSESGAVAVIAALSLTGVVGSTALAVELGQGYLAKTKNQRVADMAALGAALAYQAKNGDQTVLVPTANDIAKSNGIINGTDGATVTVTPNIGANSTLDVTIVTRVPVALASVIGMAGSYNVKSLATASLNSSPPAPACITALSSSATYGVQTGGGASLTTNGCAISSVSSVYNGGGSISANNSTISSGSGSVGNNYGSLTANTIYYSTSFNSPSYATVNGAKVQKTQTIVDPLKGDPFLYGTDGTGKSSGAFYNANPSNIGSKLTLPASPSDPVLGTCTAAYKDWGLTSSGVSPDPTNVTYASGTKTWTIKPGIYCINKLTTEGGMGTITFQGTIANPTIVYIKTGFSPSSPVSFGYGTIKITGGFNNNSNNVTFAGAGAGTAIEIGSSADTNNYTSTVTIGDAAVKMAGSNTIGGSATLTMGAGAHAFKDLTISGSGTLIAGTGNFDVGGKTDVAGGGVIAAGLVNTAGVWKCPSSASTNYAFGASGGVSINLQGSGNLIMCDGTFSANGAITTQGGSRLIFGSTANHYINGNLTIAGSVMFGRGLYTIAGNMTNSTGGTTWPWTWGGVTYGGATSPAASTQPLTYADGTTTSAGSGFDQIGVDVTFVANGTINLGGGAKTYLQAPATTGPTGIAGVVFASLWNSATSIGAGSANALSGMVYLPNSDVTMSGGAGVSGSGAGCFMLVANTVNVSGGASASTQCTNLGSGTSSTGSVGLIR